MDDPVKPQNGTVQQNGNGTVDASAEPHPGTDVPAQVSQITRQKVVTTLIICFCNLINFMDRYALPGILPMVIDDLNINNLQAGLLQSAFIVSYVAVAPLIGFLGDRYSRRWIMAIGLFIWSILTLTSSFMKTFGPLIALRCLGGIGEATYSAIGPAIIGDLFVGDVRSRFLALFYFTTLTGSGLGFITGSAMAAATNSWNWGLRVTPILSVTSVVLIIFFMRDPPRGESEGSHLTSTSWRKDIIYLVKNPSFMLSTIGSVGVTFTVGAIAAWGPQFVYQGQVIIDENHEPIDEISLKFGIVTIVSGLLGVVSGSFMGQKLRVYYPSADAIICGVGMLCSAPLFYGVLTQALGPLWVIYLLCFAALWFINLNWALVGDILLYVVIPTRRATAESFQILVCHVFGDASSPFIVGLISDAIKPGIESASEAEMNFRSLEYGLFIVLFIEALGGFVFLACSWYLVRDRAKATRAIAIGLPDQAIIYDRTKPSQVQLLAASSDPNDSALEPMLLVKRSSTQLEVAFTDSAA